jgi:hypothetical protein
LKRDGASRHHNTQECPLAGFFFALTYKESRIHVTRANGIGESPLKNVIVCSPKRLPKEKLVHAARTAVDINPMNNAPLERLTRVMRDFKPTPDRLAW